MHTCLQQRLHVSTTCLQAEEPSKTDETGQAEAEDEMCDKTPAENSAETEHPPPAAAAENPPPKEHDEPLERAAKSGKQKSRHGNNNNNDNNINISALGIFTTEAK